MSVNRNQEHLLILPEDKACGDIVAAFIANVEERFSRKAQLLSPAGGWRHAIEQVSSDDNDLGSYPMRHLLLVIDFDDHAERRNEIEAAIPQQLSNRVYIVGSLKEAEDLKPVFGRYELVGEALWKACMDQTNDPWEHELLAHNLPEVKRLMPIVQRLLFGR